MAFATGERTFLSQRFLIQGGRQLKGRYPVQGNKNAALPLIAASLLAEVPVLLRRVPRIRDVEHLLALLTALGVQVQWREEELWLDGRGIQKALLPASLVEQLRGSVLLLGPLASRWRELCCAVPGGCPIGRRSFDVHWRVFRAAGFSVREGPQQISLRLKKAVRDPCVYLPESSVTATENALLLFAAQGGGVIQNPAREPHVLSLIQFLESLGHPVELHPLYYRVGPKTSSPEREVRFQVPGDYIDAGTMAIAAAVTGGEVELEGISLADLMGVIGILREFGIQFEETGEGFRVWQQGRGINPRHLVAGLWPSFPTDLVSLAIVLATQCRGICLIHDWMYEARMFFIDKLVRMGARITLCDPHRVMVEGPTRLRGTRLESPDIRAGMALVVAGLCARGTTTIEHAEVIMRGYEKVVPRLRGIGAEVWEEGGSNGTP